MPEIKKTLQRKELIATEKTKGTERIKKYIIYIKKTK